MGIVLTEKAASEVKRIIADQKIEPEMVLRVGVTGGGCSGFSYALGFDKSFDEKVDAKYEYHGVPVVVDKKSALYLDGTTIDFYEGLEADNSKTYWTAHKTVYDDMVRAPMDLLLAELEPEFGPARLSRPNRDIRFAADKSPYKTNIYASARDGGYVALNAAGLTAAGGRYMMDTAALARYRAGVAADSSGKKVVALVDALRAKGYELNEPELKRVPPPFGQDHPRGDLLRLKQLIYWRSWDAGRWIASAEALERVREAWRDGAALNAWFTKYVGA